jgi:hypothetical protein
LVGLGVKAKAAPIEITGHRGEYATVAIGGAEDPIEWNLPGVMGVYDPVRYGDDFDDLLLISNGTDLTAEFSACIESSGFYLPDPVVDPREEEVAKQAVAEASNQWAACARDNGLADMLDATVTVDDWETVPSVEVPASVDLQLFEQVLANCPPLDPSRDLAKGNLVEDGDKPPVDPEITFGAPPDSRQRADLEQALVDRIDQLYQAAEGKR